jgi:uncharacterized protein (UPF0147 family)
MDDATVPAVVRAAVDRARREGRAASVAAAELWLGASWRLAGLEDCSAEEFASWVDVGCWNLAGNAADLERFGVFRQLAGARGYELVRIDTDPQTVLERVLHEGVDAVLDAAEVMAVLQEFAADERASGEPSGRDGEPSDSPRPTEGLLDFS